MREFKFRAWNKTTRKMTIIYSFAQFKDEIIMQWTGLKDKNDVDIYEGDIISNDEETFAIIKFVTGSFSAWNEEEIVWDFPLKEYSPEPYVRGNIYEKPELMKE